MKLSEYLAHASFLIEKTWWKKVRNKNDTAHEAIRIVEWCPVVHISCTIKSLSFYLYGAVKFTAVQTTLEYSVIVYKNEKTFKTNYIGSIAKSVLHHTNHHVCKSYCLFSFSYWYGWTLFLKFLNRECVWHALMTISSLFSLDKNLFGESSRSFQDWSSLAGHLQNTSYFCISCWFWYWPVVTTGLVYTKFFGLYHLTLFIFGS